jgi:hypothetical protein
MTSSEEDYFGDDVLCDYDDLGDELSDSTHTNSYVTEQSTPKLESISDWLELMYNDFKLESIQLFVRRNSKRNWNFVGEENIILGIDFQIFAREHFIWSNFRMFGGMKN